MVKREDCRAGRVPAVLGAVHVLEGRQDEGVAVLGRQGGGLEDGDALVVEAGLKGVWEREGGGKRGG
jgi:uncharacterized cupin superfamily protein